MRRIVFILLLLTLACAGQGLAAPRNIDNYPLRVHIYDKHQHRNRRFHAYIGHGRGNIIEGDQINGMEYSFDCLNHFLDSETDEYYPAKWKKPGFSIELLMGVIGSDSQTRTCELKVALRDYAFARINGKLVHLSPDEYKSRELARVERAQALTPRDTDPAHYPVELSLLNLHWIEDVNGLHGGSGQGNLKTPTGLAAVDFSIQCPVIIQTTPEGRYYRGQWVDQDHEMTLLLGNLRDPGADATCDVTTNIHTDVYVRQSAGIIKAVSQEEYARTQKQVAAGPGVSPTTP
jgi:hypothetical protein